MALFTNTLFHQSSEILNSRGAYSALCISMATHQVDIYYDSTPDNKRYDSPSFERSLQRLTHASLCGIAHEPLSRAICPICYLVENING